MNSITQHISFNFFTNEEPKDIVDDVTIGLSPALRLSSINLSCINEALSYVAPCNAIPNMEGENTDTSFDTYVRVLEYFKVFRMARGRLQNQMKTGENDKATQFGCFLRGYAHNVENTRQGGCLSVAMV